MSGSISQPSRTLPEGGNSDTCAVIFTNPPAVGPEPWDANPTVRFPIFSPPYQTVLLLAVISRICAASAEDIFVVVAGRIDKLTIMSENDNSAVILCAIGDML